MAQEDQATSGLGIEWRVTMSDGSSKTLVPGAGGLASRIWLGMKGMISGLVLKVRIFLKKAWDLGLEDPRKIIHGLKVGMALTVVTLFYYMRPLYEGFGGNAMWAIMTVVVVFENNVGATIYKSLNRVFATTLAGFLGIGVHCAASQSGEKFEPLVTGASVFLLASAATFSKFIPLVKDRFDYGCTIFILTFSLVTVSGYRVDKLFDLAHDRMSTIVTGTSLCVLVSMLICPTWSGQELHVLICRNMDKLANSLDGCVAEYFSQNGELTNGDKNLLDYKCVISSKASEESMAILARWEPAHGPFSFKHPWKQYLKIGASTRNCAYCIEAIRSCIDSEIQAPDCIKGHLSNICLRVSNNSSSVIRELATMIKTLKKSSKIDFLIEEMNDAVGELRNEFKFLCDLSESPELSLPDGKKTETTTASAATFSLMEIIPAVTLGSLLIETTARVEAVVDAVQELSNMAEFKAADQDSSKQNQPTNRIAPDQLKGEETRKALQRV